MLFALSDIYLQNNVNEVTQILISLCIMLFAGFLLTRVTKLLKLPNVTGYIFAGILIGPSVLGLVPQNIVSNMGFVSDIAMTFIAFSVGRFFTLQVLKKDRKKVLTITLLEVLATAGIMIVVLKCIFNMPWSFTLILSSMAIATAPASIMMIIQQYKAKGSYVETLLQVIAYGNVICLLLFGIISSVVNATIIGSISALDVILPIVYNLGSMLLGFIFGIVLGKLLSVPTRSSDNRLILLVSMLLALAGLCALVDISAHIACMVFGATYINYTKDKKLYKELTSFTPPIMSVFFVLSGMNLSLTSLASVGLIGVVYTIVRIIGKYGGTFVGSCIAKTPPVYKKYLGLSLVPQAGVAIGLAFLAQRILPAELGNTILTIILASSVLYEIIGPACAKASLFLAGAIKQKAKVPTSTTNNTVKEETAKSEEITKCPNNEDSVCDAILCDQCEYQDTCSIRQVPTDENMSDILDDIEE